MVQDIYKLGTSVAYGLQPMANINNEQRKAFADIVHANGRLEEFTAKYGRKPTAVQLKAANSLFTAIKAKEAEKNALDRKQSAEREALSKKHSNALDAIGRDKRMLEQRLRGMNFTTDHEYVDGEYTQVVKPDNSGARAEYEMFKKRALADIWGADTLEGAKQAMSKYLDLVR